MERNDILESGGLQEAWNIDKPQSEFLMR
jgi:hypothetical protein